MGERYVRNVQVVGSIPIISTTFFIFESLFFLKILDDPEFQLVYKICGGLFRTKSYRLLVDEIRVYFYICIDRYRIDIISRDNMMADKDW